MSPRTRWIFAGLLFAVVSDSEFLPPRVVRAADDAATPAWSGPAADEELRPFRLGLQATNPWNERARALSIRAAAGAAVLRVDAGTAAHTAGLRAGDLIVRFGEYDVENIEDLIAAAASVPGGSQQTVIFVRGE